MISRLWTYLCSYRVTWFPAYQIHGRDSFNSVYMTRFHLTPQLPWGRLYLHRFHREDMDRDPHDHPFNFWTFPLNQGYTEQVFEAHGDCMNRVHVKRWRWQHRPATHRHRVVETDRGSWPLWTLVWRGHNVRKWGFWVYTERTKNEPVRPYREWVFWKRYVDVQQTDGADDAAAYDDFCPGTLAADVLQRTVPTLPAPGWKEDEKFSTMQTPGQM